jgi:hypothetical protein
MYRKLLWGNLAALVFAGALSAPAYAAEQQAFGYTSDDEHEALVATPDASSGSCGVERWSVKTGTDADVGLVNLSSTQPNTIVTMRSWTAPNPIPPNNRVQPYETTTWVLNATLVEYKLETDSDYHLVIQDASGNTMIAEIPDPACVSSSSPFSNLIQSARAQFDAKYSATTSFQTANIPVQITGVGMFDFLHGQTGVAPNGIEVHPVLDIQFNPSSGGGGNFALSASPATVSAYPGASATTTITDTPSGGFTGSVALSASGVPSGVTASFSPSSTTGTSTLTLNVGAAAATGTYNVTVNGTSGSLSHSTTVTLTVLASTGGGQTAVYNSTLKAPGCATVGSSCDSGPSLLLGRANLTGGAEPNQPNTINNSCADGTSGTFHSDESNDRLVIASTDGGQLTAGKSAKITATVWAYSTSDALDLYSAANANSPSWVFLSTITPSAAGAQTLSTSFTLPSGGLQAIRANFRYGGSASSCSTGAYDDHDDLIFAVNSGSPPPADFSMAASPTSASVTQGSSVSDTITITPQNGFTGSVALSASGLPAGVTASFSPSSTTGTSTLTLTASSTATTGTATVTVTGTSGSLTHSTTLSLTLNPAAAPNFSLSDAPGSLSIAQGSSGTSTISVTPQNGFTGSVSLSASGLPSGVTASFNPSSTTGTSTLTLTASSTATTGTATVTITGTSGSLTHTTTLSLTVTAASTSVQLLGNTGFESTASWTASSGVICATGCSGESAHTGSGFAWMNGYGSAHTDTVSQAVTIPSGKTTGTLQFYLHIDTAETGTTAYDKLTVTIGSTTVATFSNVNAAAGYQVHSYNVPVTAGSSVTVKFNGVEDASLQTSFVLDDVTFTVK